MMGLASKSMKFLFIFLNVLAISGILQPPLEMMAAESPEPYLWADAPRIDQEWRHSDWYGYLSDTSYPWIWHSEHGWQWCVGQSKSNVFFWDVELDSWIWTNNSFYPWIYKNGVNEGWMYYFQSDSDGIRYFYHRENADYYSDNELRIQLEEPTHTSLPQPLFSTPGGTFIGSHTVILSSEKSGADIRYTLDGTIPTEESLIYSDPLVINKITQVRARLFLSGSPPGPVASEIYLALDPELKDFDSNLPIVLIDTSGWDIDSEVYPRGTENPWPQRPVSAIVLDTNELTGRTGITGTPDFSGRAGMRLRGNSSQEDFPKKSYKFEVWDEDDADLDVSLLGFPEDSDWVLYAPYTDKTLMRNFIAYSWSREMGNYVTRTRYLEIFANMNGDNVISHDDYLGVYILMEKYKRHNDRIDISKLRPIDLVEPEITGGYILKADWGDDFQLDRTKLFMEYVDPGLDELTAEQKDWIEGYFNDVEAAVYAPDFRHPKTGEHYTDLLDPRSCIERQVIQELTKNMDARSTFLYKDRYEPLKFGPVWDYNYALGNTDIGWTWCKDCFGACPCYSPEGWATFYYAMNNNRTMGWWSRFKEDPDYWQYWIDRWAELRRDILSTESILSEMDALYEMLKEPAARNFERWPVLNLHTRGNSFWGTTQNPHTYEEEVTWLQDWLMVRLAWLDSQFHSSPDFNQDGGLIEKGFPLELTNPNPSGTIYYTLDGTDPRVPLQWPAEDYNESILISETPPTKVLIPSGPLLEDWTHPSFDDSAWISGTGGVGFDLASGYGDYYNLNIETEMRQNNSTCYIRIPFSVDTDELPRFHSLNLNIRYDDGFVAYLNGNRIAAVNAPEPLLWNSSADGNHDPENAISTISINLSNYLNTLNPGENNVLAIHGLNDRPNGGDFLISSGLVADDKVSGTTAAQAMEYVNPILLDGTTEVNSRVLISGQWGPLHGEVFTSSTAKESLRVTEIHYHPVIAEAEFIELQNMGAEAIELNQIRFTDGIEFTFPRRTLLPGEVVIVVANEDIFETEYGLGFPVIGTFSGRLSNGGEHIQLVDAINQVILEFTYSDNWVPETDGDGYSLVFIDPADADTDSWNSGTKWRASESIGGTPGIVD